jgi:threonine dehydratase
MIPFAWLEQAAARLADYVSHTPLTYDEENRLYLKWENRQKTGSFKLRGALNKALALEPWERMRGLAAASAGNHGQGVAFAANLLAARAVVYASQHAFSAKVEAMRSLGAEVRLVAGGYGEAEAAGLAYARESGATWISPYNDGLVIAGQGTLALEIMAQLPAADALTWVTPVGGGGLASGIGAAIKEGRAAQRGHRLVGVQSQASAFMHGLYTRGSQDGVMDLPSLADGLAGPVEEGAITIPLARQYLDDLLLVSEDEIAQAVRYAWQRYGKRIEGSAATALAAALTGKVSARPAVIVLSGGNISPEMHLKILEGGHWQA